MNLTWWEWEEMEAAIQQRPELWLPHPDRVNTYYRQVDDVPVYALAAMPGPGSSQFRLVQLQGVPLTWTQGDVEGHMAYMRDSFTSYPFRDEVERFLVKELQMEAGMAYKVAIVIGRIQQGPCTEPLPERIPFPAEERRFHLREGGTLMFRRQGDMLRCAMELGRMGSLGPTSSSFLMLDGFMRVRGKSTKQSIDWLLYEGDQGPHIRTDRRADREVSVEQQDEHLPLEGDAPRPDDPGPDQGDQVRPHEREEGSPDDPGASGPLPMEGDPD